eukprot:CAMPEP_0114292640 /NCGR_PEP_ID=MMETSP0059-20121206/9172_1 /TAXON_ID=36894 /ORGANISM="Pyramimonas parkeae, Strain CCMP726" /LENGTH=386 /DNA_ID=CAMNT_0001414307 /DNA_START=15 /DNA_END=1175 /DNA_ORIENTATION=-
MGIHGLSKLLSDNAPGCVREQKFESYFGRKVAVDASMHIYSFLMVIGRLGESTLTNEAGETTSHLQGLFYRTTRMLEAGMKPVFVFDGKPPELKSKELAKRKEGRDKADVDLVAAKETGDDEALEKASKKLVKVTRQHNDECKRLLKLMGVPVIEAPSEAEAQCAALCQAGLVHTVCTEDMDVLTFGTARSVRNLMTPASQKKTIMEFELAKALEGLELTMDQFIDLCILLGCDYCQTIKGVGPVSALKLIKQHGSLEKVLESLDGKKFNIPEIFPYQEARQLFREPQVLAPQDVPDMKWTLPDEEGLIQFMVNEQNFNLERVKANIEKLKGAKGKSSQGRLESFFGATTTHSSSLKRKPEPVKGKGAAKGALANKKSKGVGGKRK